MTTRRILFVCHDAGGNVPPVLALAESLIRNGHHAVVLSQPSVRRRVADIGCEFFEFSAIADYERGKMLEEQLDAAMSVIAERSAGDDLISLATERGFDLVVVDANMAGALAAAETLEQPSVVLLHSMYKTYVDVWLGAVWPLLSNTVNSMRSGFGLGPADSWVDLLAGHDCRLSVVPSMFEAPVTDIQTAIASLRVPRAPSSSIRRPRMVPARRHPDGVGRSQHHHHRQTELLQTIVAVLGEMPVRALVTTAGVVDTESWRRPSNVAIADYVPHASVMDQTDVMVNHAGLGSVATALELLGADGLHPRWQGSAAERCAGRRAGGWVGAQR